MEEEKSGSSDKMVDENESVTPSKSEESHKKPKEAERIIRQVI